MNLFNVSVLILLIIQNITSKEIIAQYDEENQTIIFENQVYLKINTNNNFLNQPIIPLRFSHSNSAELEEQVDELHFWFYLFIVLFLTCFAGLMSGLTVGYLSIDDLVLELKTKTGDEKEKEYAHKVLPILANRHWLLVTLLLSNAFAMEALPLYLDKIVPEYLAIIISVSLVLVFGEVLPQAVCTGPDQVKIAALVAPAVRYLMLALSPICYPIAKILDKVLGEHHKSRFVNTDLKALIELHTYNALKNLDIETDDGTKPSAAAEHKPEEHLGEMGLLDEQANLMISAIDIRNKKSRDLMIPIKNTFMIDFDDQLDKFKLNLILDKGYSRIPVYANHNKNDVIGLLRMKKLIGVDTNQNKSLRQLGIQLGRPIVISPELSVLELLKEFRRGVSHMAFVTEQVHELQAKLETTTKGDVDKSKSVDSFKFKNIPIKIIGIITLEDVIEKIINLDILDEDDYNRLVKRTKQTNSSTNRLLKKNLCQELTKSFINNESYRINSLLKESYNKNSFKETFLSKEGEEMTPKRINNMKDPLL